MYIVYKNGCMLTIGKGHDWGEPERALHLSVLQDKPHTYVCTYVCMYVAICRPRDHHASALACVRHKVHADKYHQHVPCVNSKYSSLKLLQESQAVAS